MGKKRKGRAVRKALARWRSASNLLKGIKTVARSSPRSRYLNPALAKYREGAAHSEPPTGAIVRNSGRVMPESIWVADTNAE